MWIPRRNLAYRQTANLSVLFFFLLVMFSAIKPILLNIDSYCFVQNGSYGNNLKNHHLFVFPSFEWSVAKRVCPTPGWAHEAFLLVLTARWMEDFKDLTQGHGTKLNGPYGDLMSYLVITTACSPQLT